jgi:hypothetical protein
LKINKTIYKMIWDEISNNTIVSEKNLVCLNCKQQKFSDACSCLTEDKNANNETSLIVSNLKNLKDLTVRLDDYLSIGVPQIQKHHQDMKSTIENHFKSIVERFEESKDQLLGVLRLNEIHFNQESENIKQIFEDTREKMKLFSVGDHSSTTIEKDKFYNEIEIVKERIGRVLDSISDVAIYKKPSSDFLESNFSESLWGSVEYQDYESLISFGKTINVSRLQKQKYYLPRILKHYKKLSEDYKIIDIIISPFLNSKLVVCTYGMTKSECFEVIIQLFDYENELKEIRESWDLQHCHLLDMITYDKAIILSVKNELNKFALIIYDESLHVKKSVEHQFYTESMFANDNGIFLIHNQVPFVHFYDWNLCTELKSFGQHINPQDRFFITNNDEILIALDKLITFNIDNLLIKIYNLDHGYLLKEINLNSFFSSLPRRVLFTIDNDEKLILACVDEKILQVYNSIKENEVKILFEREVSEITCVSSINITNNGLLVLNDTLSKKVYLY